MRGNMTLAARLGLAFAVAAPTVAVGLLAFRSPAADVRDGARQIVSVVGEISV